MHVAVVDKQQPRESVANLKLNTNTLCTVSTVSVVSVVNAVNTAESVRLPLERLLQLTLPQHKGQRSCGIDSGNISSALLFFLLDTNCSKASEHWGSDICLLKGLLSYGK